MHFLEPFNAYSELSSFLEKYGGQLKATHSFLRYKSKRKVICKF